MCLGIPGRIESLSEGAALRTGRVDFGGAAREICLAYVPEAAVGDYVIVHAGFAISVVDEAAAKETFRYLGEIQALMEKDGPAPNRRTRRARGGGSDRGDLSMRGPTP